MKHPDPKVEAQMQSMLDRMKARAEAVNGPGAFEDSLRRGQLLISKRAEDLTPEERAFLDAPPPARRQ